MNWCLLIVDWGVGPLIVPQIQNLQSEIHDPQNLTHLSMLFRLKRSRPIA